MAVATKKKEFDKLGVQVLYISVDTQFVHKAWDDTELSKKLGGPTPYPMVWDVGGAIGKKYGVYDEGIGLDIRGSFFIDPEGILQAFEIHTPPVGRNIQETLRRFRALQHSATGKACPANWDTDKSDLSPSPELVGKVLDEWNP